MKFSSRKDRLVYIFFFGSIASLIALSYFILSEKITTTSLILLAVILGIFGFLVWILFGTGYELKNELLLYHTGPINGKIKINSIHTIVKGKTLWVGFKPATAQNGLIIKYGKYDEIYISPENNVRFINEILKHKSEIKIVDHSLKK